MKVALVHPPFAPAGVPSLGLGLLHAGVRARGLECRTFYWGLDLVPEFPGAPRERADLYDALTSRRFHPFNEWIFAGALHGDALPAQQPALQQAYFARHGDAPASIARGRAILALRERAVEWVEAMAERLSGFDVVGLASTFFQNVPALALAKRLKALRPQQHVVLGGANADGGMGRALLELFPFLDAVFEGEVDHAFPDYVRRRADGQATDDVAGLVRRGPDGQPLTGPAAVPLADLDSLPVPDFDDYVEAFTRSGLGETRELTLALESSRGCWWGERQHCTFCGLNASGMGYRTKSPERFFDEVTAVVERHRVGHLLMTDNILAPRYDERFAEWTARRGVRVQFFYEIKANVRRAQAERLVAAGITAVQPGIESLSARLLQQIRKGVTPLQNVAFLKHARELGLLPAYNLLVGIPGEHADDYAPLRELLPKLAHLHPPAAVAPVEFHRFSPYQREPQAFGLELRPAADYHFLHPFGDDALARIGYFFEDVRGAQLGPHVREFAQAVMAWCAAWREDDCLLTWQQIGDEVVVDDRRPGFGPRQWRLGGFAAAIVPALTDVGTLSGLLRLAREHADGGSGAEERSFATEPPGARAPGSARREPPDGGSGAEERSFATEPPRARAPGSARREPPDGEATRGADATALRFCAADFVARPRECLQPLFEAGLLLEEGGGAHDCRLLALPVAADWRRTPESWTRTRA
ncbi:MAG: RiPP maturation radical SAM C-methyltransferase [Vicinamibacteria bacterium]|nr:RiPP maturation radical SAM C-methyltransferase [Vicinamibacteria bacterium]